MLALAQIVRLVFVAVSIDIQTVFDHSTWQCTLQQLQGHEQSENDCHNSRQSDWTDSSAKTNTQPTAFHDSELGDVCDVNQKNPSKHLSHKPSNRESLQEVVKSADQSQYRPSSNPEVWNSNWEGFEYSGAIYQNTALWAIP